MVVHVRELPGQVVIECSGAIHSEPDRQSPSGDADKDADKAVAHHHGCHSASFTLASTQGVDLIDPMPANYSVLPVDALASAHAGPDLRPPIA
jgi:hypothetical protein